jgi:hypothetical protein
MIIANAELARMWKEEIVAYFKVLSQHLSGGTEKTTYISGLWATGVRTESGTSRIRNRYVSHYTATFNDRASCLCLLLQKLYC